MRKEGFYVIDDYIDHRTIRDYMFFPLNINGEEYFFKWIKNDDDSYNELIAEELASDFGIPCAKYDLATYHGYNGVITKNFIKPGDRFYTGYDLMQKVLPDSETKFRSIKYNNLDFYRNLVSKEVFEQMEDMFMFDILTANVDRTENNFGFLENESGTTLAPIYDHEKILSNSSIIQGYYRMSVDSDDDLYSFKQDPLRYRNIVRRFILKYNKGKLLEQKLGLISLENIDDIISRVEDRIEADLPERKVVETKKLFYENSLKISKQLY